MASMRIQPFARLNLFRRFATVKRANVASLETCERKFSTTCPRHTGTGFARRLAIGELNMSWICPYATLDSEDELQELNELAANISKFYSEKVDSAKIDRDAQIDPDVLQGLKDLGLFGLQVPAEYGGLGLSNVKYARVLEEISADSSITMMITAHLAMGLKSILLAGSEEQKKKYISRLAAGELVAAFCLSEPSSGSDIASIETQAHLSEDGKHWILNGEKRWVTNGGFADVMVVFAETELEGSDGKPVEKMTAFIVERSFGGVTSGEADDKHGVRGSNSCSVSFENTHVPVGNVLGFPGEGFKLAMSVLNSGRFSMGAGVAGQLKRVLTMVTQHANSRVQFGKKISEFGLVQEKLFDLVLKTYAMESMAYMTAGQMDIVAEDALPQDCTIEAAMVKIYSSEAAYSCASECMQICGGLGYLKDSPVERLLRDSRALLMHEGTNEVLRLYVALSILQYAGFQKKKKLELITAGHIGERLKMYKDLMTEWRYKKDDDTFAPTASFGLSGPSATKSWLHPSMEKMGQTLEKSSGVFSKRVLSQLILLGKNIQDDQIILKTFADVAINLYAMASVIARCNKAKLLDLRNCDHEFMVADAFVRNTYRENSLLMQKLLIPYPFDWSSERETVCKDIMKERRYLCSHPLEVVHRYQENPIYLEQFEKVKKLSS